MNKIFIEEFKNTGELKNDENLSFNRTTLGEHGSSISSDEYKARCEDLLYV